MSSSAPLHRLAVGCVADSCEKYLDQALRLLQSWRWFAGPYSGAEFHVCVVGDVPMNYRRQYERYGANVHVVPRFSERHPPSNKLRFLELDAARTADRAILLDCDTVVVQIPEQLFCGDGLTAKIADVATMTLDSFEGLFTAFDMPMPQADQQCTVSGEGMIPYFNAGVLSFSRQALKTLVPTWLRLNRSLIEKIELLGERSNFCEQASLSLALTATGTPFRTLGNEMNFPAHFDQQPQDSEFAQIDPTIIHYHWLVDDAGLLLSSPYLRVNRRIEELNLRLREESARLFDNRSFWNERYATQPELGSGVGSRGIYVSYKRALLERVLEQARPASILDIGCGDMTVSQCLPASGYLGIDVSDTVINDNRSAFPDREFVVGDLLSLELAPADLVVCLDVLIHLPDPTEYVNFVSRCVALGRKGGVLAGYEAPPQNTSSITFFYKPLSQVLRECGATHIRQVGGYRQVAVFQFGIPADDTPPLDVDSRKHIVRPVFLVGTMRSGTTLLADLLGQSPYLAHCPFELKDVWSRAGGIPMASAKTRDLTCPECSAIDARPAIADALAKAFFERMLACEGKVSGAALLNKNPHLCNKLPLVRALFPDARFIWVRRDLPQVVASIKRLFVDVQRRQNTWHWWPYPTEDVRNRCWNTIHSAEQCSEVPSDRLFPGGNVGYIAEYWLESNRAAAAFLRTLPMQQRIEVAEESLLSELQAELARVFAKLQIPLLEDSGAGHVIDHSRNSRWADDLDEREIGTLRGFVAKHAAEIDSLFDARKTSTEYLAMLAADFSPAGLARQLSRAPD